MPSARTLGQPPQKRQRLNRVPGVVRDDSDDELGDEDYPWEWIYSSEAPEATAAAADDDDAVTPSRKRKRAVREERVIGARMGSFECHIGDCMLLKAEGSNEAWVGIICELFDDDGDDGEKAARFMWFSTHQEIRNKQKKRTDYLPNELYITPSYDINPLSSINGKAIVLSPAAFSKRYPNGRVPRNSSDFGKVFICRRACNSRTASYSDEFVWEDIYTATEDGVLELSDYVKSRTKATRRKRQPSMREESPDIYEFVDDDDGEARSAAKLRTPKKARTYDATTPTSGKKRTPGKNLTPSHRKIMIKKDLEFTPLATRVLSPSHAPSSPFQLARANLHVASVPTSLPCREGEFGLVYDHLERAITDGSGTCIYISGTPGTGKTATVREVVSRLDGAVAADELDDFVFVEINGMKITDPHQAYSLLWEALRGQRVSPAQALDLLEREFSTPSPRRVPCVVLMDELDQLVTRNQGVMYNFFNWPGLRHSRLIVLAVANTMDLPERTLSNKISSRLGLTRITFPGYTHAQLMKIVQSRLEGVPGGIVEPEAVEFASRKVAAVSGDARRALDICRRAVEIAEAEFKAAGGDAGDESGPGTPSKRKSKLNATATPEKKKKRGGRVTIDTVRRAIAEATASPLQLYLKALPFTARLLLATLVMRAERTGLAESSVGDVLEEMGRRLKFAADCHPLEALEQKKSETKGVTGRLAGLGAAAVDLMGAGIVYLEGHRAERPSKIRLAVGDEEVRMACRDDPELKSAGVALD